MCQVWILASFSSRPRSLAWCDTGWNESGHADVVVGAVGAFGHHDVRGHARQVRLVGQRDQVEQQVDLRAERVQLADRRLRHVDARQVAARRQLHAPLDLAHRLEVVVEDHAIARARGPAAARPCGRGCDRAGSCVWLVIAAALLGRVALRRTAARTPCAGCTPSAAASARRGTTAWCCRSTPSRCTRPPAGWFPTATSSDGSVVSWPIRCATTWSSVADMLAPGGAAVGPRRRSARSPAPGCARRPPSPGSGGCRTT